MQKFSEVTKTYLCRFYEILDEMISSMTGAELTNSISRNFIVQMIPHHMAAIEMSKNLLQYTTCIPLQEIAQRIINEQTQSIEDMRRVLCDCEKLENTPQDICLYTRSVERIINNMFCQMRDACADNNINADFIREMIPHHEGAIKMAETALCYEICPELIPILQSIISEQKMGICRMKHLLNCIC